jgi:glutathione S-transferase
MADQPRIQLHWLSGSRGDRVVFCLEELKLKYDVTLYMRDRGSKFKSTPLLKVHPLGKCPVIDVNGVRVAESAVILEYLVEKFGQGSDLDRPLSEEDRWKVKYALHHSESTLMPDLTTLFMSQTFVRSQSEEVADKFEMAYLIPDLKKQLKFLNDQLVANGTGYFASDHLTLADVMYSFPISVLHVMGTRGRVKLSDYPELDKWFAMISERESYKRCQQVLAGWHKVKKERAVKI